MKVRPFELDQDFDSIKDWINDERSHAMWCANNVEFPISKESFGKLMDDVAVKCSLCSYRRRWNDRRILLLLDGSRHQ